MSKRSITIAELPTVEQPDADKLQVVEVSVSYNAGGMNYFNYTTMARGYELHVTVMKTSYERGFRCREYSIGTGGLRAAIEPATRFNAKTLQKHADAALKSAIFPKVLVAVLIHSGVHLTPESEAQLSAAGMRLFIEAAVTA